MKNVILAGFSVFVTIVMFTSCKGNTDQTTHSHDDSCAHGATVSNQVLTAEQQALLTPDVVIEMLKQGNKDYTDNKLTVLNNTERIESAVAGQHPKAVIVSCLDSRVPVEDVFHQGIGDLFVARVAGNFVNEDILGSLEYACKVSGSKVILVLGHEHCGAVKAAIDDVKLGNITAMLSKIQPAVTNAKRDFDGGGEKNSKNKKFVEAVCQHNVKHTIKEIRLKSPILKEMEDNGDIKIIGGVYRMETGHVDFTL